MAGKDLRKMNRAELLELLIAQTERADRMEAELEAVRLQLRDRQKVMELAAAMTRTAQSLEAKLDTVPVSQHAALVQKAAQQAKVSPNRPVSEATVTEPSKSGIRRQPAPQKQQISQPTVTTQKKTEPQRQSQPDSKVQNAVRPDLIKKETKHETNGIDRAAIAAITSGIGMGKI